MKHLDIPKPALIVLLLAVLLAAGAPGLRAQSSFVLSKHADFSTDDRVFDPTDTIHMLVTAPQIDATDLKKNEFRLKPDDGGNDIRGVFTNHLDGTYTASVPLSITDPNEDEWAWRARIEDESGNEFDVRIDLQIGEDDDGEDGDDDEGDDDGDDDDEDDDDEDEGDDEVEFTGTVDALDAGSITVDGIVFVVDAGTVVFDHNNNPILFDDLMVGMTVEIRGDRGADDVLVATRIKIEDEDEGDDEVEFTGTVDALDAGSITVDGIVFVVDAGTVVFDHNNNPILFDDLMVGMTVEIRGDRGADDVLVATRIKIEDEDEGDDEVEFTGTVDALDAGSITVDGIVFVVDAGTVVLDHNNNLILFSDLTVGMTVEIRGDRGADGVLVATRIKIEDESNAPDATGRLAAVQEDRLTVNARTFLIDDATQVLDANGTAMGVAGLEIGQTVAVHARDGGAALPVAARVKVLGGADIAAATESDENAVPTGFLLAQNYPNPFNPKTMIAFEIGQQASAEPVSLVIYNLLGEVVQTLVQGQFGPGRYQYEWDGRASRGHAVATGLYLYRLRVGEQVQTRTMVLLK